MKGKLVLFVGLLILLTLAIYSPNLKAADIAPLNIPIQGKLTDPAGIPLNGTFSVTFSLYDVAEGGVALCHEIRSVTVVGGLFSDQMQGGCYSIIRGQKVYLGIKVEADEEMLPRQVIYPVPYALNLRPRNTYIFVPGTAMVREKTDDLVNWDMTRNGSVTITTSSVLPKTYNVFFPITLPGLLHGQSQRIESIMVYYKCSAGAPNFINRTYITKQTDADSWLDIRDDPTERKAVVATDYSLAFDTNNVLTSADGIVGLFLRLNFTTNADPITIGGIRILLIDNW